MSVQVPNGVVDIAVDRRGRRGRGGQAVPRRTSRARCRRAGSAPTSGCSATLVPENRLRVYDVRRVIETLADTGSVLELRAGLRRRDGHRAGPHRGPPARASSPTTRATSAAPSTPTAPTRRRGSCSCATPSTCRSSSCATRPGFMVGPEAEKTAPGAPLQPRMFVTGANLTVPFFTIVLRKGYGLGAQAMAGGSSKAPGVHGGLADRRVRRHGPGGRGASSASATSWRRSRTPPSARSCFEQMVAAPTSTARRVNIAIALRDRRRHRPGRLAALDHGRAALGAAPAAAHGQEATEHRHLVTEGRR